MTEIIEGLAIVILVLGVYTIPTWIAAARKHKNTLAIAVLNILLGWTFIGWVASLVWSCTDNVEARIYQ